MGRLLGSKGGRIVFGLLAIGAALIFGFVPHTEHYQSIYGFGTVDVKCGSFAHRQVAIDAKFGPFSSGDASTQELNTLPVFEGKTASQVCDGSLSSAKTYTIAAAVVGGIAILVGLASPSRRRAAPILAPSTRLTPAAATPVRRPASKPAQGRRLPANPSWAQPTSPGSSSVGPSSDEVALPMAPPRAASTGPVPFASKPLPNQSTPSPATVNTTDAALPPAPHTSAAASQVPSIPISYPVSLSIPRSSAALPPPAAPLSPESQLNATQRRPSPLEPVPFTVVFNNGARVRLVDTVVVGRDPDARTRGVSHRIDDPLLSKTHLTIGRTVEGQTWVEDRGSVNGTEVHSARGETIEVVAGVRVPLSSDSSVSFGDSSFVIERG